jgi:trans-L-3-hydroxyproline dehydratase
MCGHAVICLGRYAIDYEIVTKTNMPETQVNIQCPCGLVKAFTQYDGNKTSKVISCMTIGFVN